MMAQERDVHRDTQVVAQLAQGIARDGRDASSLETIANTGIVTQPLSTATSNVTTTHTHLGVLCLSLNFLLFD